MLGAWLSALGRLGGRTGKAAVLRLLAQLVLPSLAKHTGKALGFLFPLILKYQRTEQSWSPLTALKVSAPVLLSAHALLAAAQSCVAGGAAAWCLPLH